MTTAQLIAILIAIVGGDGVWRFLEARLHRKDQLKDRGHKSIEDFEDSLDKCYRASLKLLGFNIFALQEQIISRENKYIGINEHRVLDGLSDIFAEMGGDGTVRSRREYIDDEYTEIPDVDLSGVLNEKEKVIK